MAAMFALPQLPETFLVFGKHCVVAIFSVDRTLNNQDGFNNAIGDAKRVVEN